MHILTATIERKEVSSTLAEALIRPLLEYGYEVVHMNKDQTRKVEQVSRISHIPLITNGKQGTLCRSVTL